MMHAVSKKGRGLLLLAALGLLVLACESKPLLPVFPIRDWSGTIKPSALPELREVLMAQLAASGRVRVKGYNPGDGRDCTGREAECAKSAGSGGHHVLAKVMRPGEDCVFVLQVRESKQPVVVRSSSLRCACNADAVLDVIPRAVAELGSIWGLAEESESLRERELVEMRERLEKERRELEKARAELAAIRAALEKQRAEFMSAEAPPVAEPRVLTLSDAVKAAQDDRIAVEGQGISAAMAEKVLKQQGKILQRCVEQHLTRDPWLPERLVLKLTVAPSGVVERAGVEGIEAANRGSYLELCILKAARRWRFSAWQGKPVKLSLPIFLARR